MTGWFNRLIDKWIDTSYSGFDDPVEEVHKAISGENSFMKMSENGVAKLAQWEGNRTRNGRHYPYDDRSGKIVEEGGDVSGYLTIGYGHLLTKSETHGDRVSIGGILVDYWKGLPEGQARDLFDQDLDDAENTVNDATKVPLTQNQFEALVSFTFNTGIEAYRTSTLLRLLNAGRYDDVPTQLRRWIRSQGQIVQGLINRREHEIEHWERG